MRARAATPKARRWAAPPRRWAAPLLLALLAALYLWEVVTGAGVPVARDMQLFFIPQKHLLREALRSADLPLWTPYVGTGAPFLANFQTGVFYPPNWAFAVLPFFPAFNLLVVLHFVAGGLFFHLLARELGLEPLPAFAAAATWTFGGYFASLLNLMNALQGAAWAPAMAWALLRWLDRRSPGAWLLVVSIGLLGLLAGEPQTFLLACGTAAIAAILVLSRRPAPGRTLGRALPGLAAAALAVAGLAAVQILPTMEFLGESSRAGGGLSYGEASGFALEPIRLLHLLVPPDYRDPEFAFGMRSVIGHQSPWLFSIYLGPVWLLLLWFGWRHAERRREVATWTAVAVLGTIVGLGSHTPVFRWLYDLVPGFGAFRFAEKYFFLAGFAAALLAGYGVKGVLAGRAGRADAAAGAGLVGLLLAARLAFARGREALEAYAATHFSNRRMMMDFDFAYGVWGENLTKLLVIGLFAVLLVALHRRGHLRTRLFGPLLAGLLVADLLVAHRQLNPVVEPEFFTETPLVARSFPLEEVQRDYRYRTTDFAERAGRLTVRTEASLQSQKWLWQQTLAPNAGQLWSVLEPDAWDAIKLRRYEDERTFLRIVPEEFRRWRLLRLLSVRYLYQVEGVDAEGYARELPLDPALPGHLYELEDPLPRAYVVPRSIRVPDEQAAINAVLAPDFDPERTVVLIDSTAAAGSRPGGGGAGGPAAAGAAAPPGGAGVATIVSQTGDELRVVLEGVRGGFLVLTDSHFPGWRALVDGEERPIGLANFFFRAVPLREGDREVVFRYEPASFRRGRIVSLATLGLAGIGFALVLVLGRRDRAKL